MTLIRLLVFTTVLLVLDCHSIHIEYPKHRLIQERFRKDLQSLDPKLRFYLVEEEIQYQSDINVKELEFFLKCSGSQGTLNFTYPPTAEKDITVQKDEQGRSIIIKLKKKKLSFNLVGRYTCSEVVSNRNIETSVHVFIDDNQTIFSKTLYPSVTRETGIHFFNIPCQTLNWYTNISCQSDSSTTGCIPVYLRTTGFQARKTYFDPQIGFLLEQPRIPSDIREFICEAGNKRRNQHATVPVKSGKPEFIQIHQPALHVLKYETVELTCEIQYGVNVQDKLPFHFWFNDINNLQLVSNQTTKPIFNPKTQVFSRNTSIVLRGFKEDTEYEFFCVRASEQGFFTRSVTINCVKAPTLEVEVNADPTVDQTYHIHVSTVPRSPIQIEIFKDGRAVNRENQFSIEQKFNRENQFFEYTLSMNDQAFEDELDYELVIRSSQLKKSHIIRPQMNRVPIGQSSFIHDSQGSLPKWRKNYSKQGSLIHFYGIHFNETYIPICTVRHPSNLKDGMHVHIQYYSCRIDQCLSTMISRECQPSDGRQRIMTTKKTKSSPTQTYWIGTEQHRMTDSSIAYQYLCCIGNSPLSSLSKSIAVLSNSRELFHVEKPEFGLVNRDALQYRCGAHPLIYRDLKIYYNDGYTNYERNRYDRQWRIKGTNQVRELNIHGSSTENAFDRTEIIEIKKSSVTHADIGHTIECTAQSKRLDTIPNANDSYTIFLEQPVPLTFKDKQVLSVVKMERRTGENIVLDCSYNGRPKPKINWFRGKLALNVDGTTVKFDEENYKVLIARAQPLDTGYYTCELTNGPTSIIRRSFDLRVKSTNPYRRINHWTRVMIGISICIAILLLSLLVFICIKYSQMKTAVDKSIFHGQANELTSLAGVPLPANFASTKQIAALLDLVNGKTTPSNNEDFKELGHGQFGVVYQIRLPDAGLVAAKLLPDSIRRPMKSRKTDKDGSRDALLDENESKRKRAVEMLIDEMKIMHKAGQHINIIGLKQVAYPETKLKLIFTPGLIRDEDSFYLMELCSNGSLESVLKSFLRPSHASLSTRTLPSLYDMLKKETDEGITLTEALERCRITEDDLKLMAYQVACGLDYLNRRQIVHCDIATRNVLVNKRFILKICDFGLATSTTYANYREQMEQNASVQIEKKTGDIATHNLTPELAKALLNSNNAEERALLRKSSIKADVWSFGIFLWTLFLKGRLRPFHQLLEECQRTPGRNFFHSLAQVIADGRVLTYISYEPEIPRDIYAFIRMCLVDDNHRPEMVRLRSFLCHQKSLSKQAFEYYRSEYNRFQEENATDGIIERFGDDQGVSDLPSFDDNTTTNIQGNSTIVPQGDDSYLSPTQPLYTNIDGSSEQISKNQDPTNDSYM